MNKKYFVLMLVGGQNYFKVISAKGFTKIATEYSHSFDTNAIPVQGIKARPPWASI